MTSLLLSMRLTKDKISASIWMVRLLEAFAFGVKKGSKYEHLVTEFNEALAQMKKDGSLEQIIQSGRLLQLRQAQRQLLLLDKKLLL